jgi:CBS domain containing-hemolysin-like protein
MMATVMSWLHHPVTLALAGTAVVLLLIILELLARRLAEMGNVRFQGLLDDHETLFPFIRQFPLPLSRVLDALRWLVILATWLMWVIIGTLPGMRWSWALAGALATVALAVLVSWPIVPRLGEDGVSVLLRLVRPVLLPVVALLARSSDSRPAASVEDEEEEASEREIRAFLDVGEAAGIIDGDEGEFLESLVDFFDSTVREVMTPRTDMLAVPDGISFHELLKTFADSHRSRIPVYSETIDHVIGVVHVKVLVEHLMLGGEPRPAELVRECMLVPESKKLGELLRDFQREHQQLAIVVDEYGGTSGLVTLEDILEEIVGEIQDEHEPRQPPEWQKLQDGSYRLQGRAPLEVLEELLGVEVHEDEVDTVGGLVFSRYGTVPEAGARVTDEALGLEFTVEQVDERRIQQVLVRRVGQPAASGE